MFAQIDNFIKDHQLIPENSIVVVGLSGGPDSVFLLHLLTALAKDKSIKLIAAHLDHEWRANSSTDVLFCQTLTKQLNVPFISKKISDLDHTIKKNGSSEELGRKLRRLFLQSVAQEQKAHLIALGHHAQDQQETFFIRLIRGTTLSGLVSMRPKQGIYIRPLLETNKSAIVHYLQTKKIDYLIDPTNESESYLRNRIRLNVIPDLHACDNRFDNNFLRTLHNLQKAELFLEKITQTQFQLISSSSEGKARIDLEKLFSLDPYLQKRILIFWLISQSVPFVPSDSLLNEIVRFLQKSGSGKHEMGTTWSLVKEQEHGWIKKKDEKIKISITND